MEDHFAQVQQMMAQHLKNSPPSLRPMMAHLLQGGGKQMRARLALLCAGVRPGKRGKQTDKLASLATSIEILHMATLVHDDVIDDADLRRGMPSLQKQYGKKTAVLAGDYLFTVCFQILAQHNQEHIDLFSRAMARICDGEIMQHQHNRDTGMSVLRYLRIILRKTGVLFGCAAAAGAKSVGAADAVVKDLTRFALYLGMIFQIVDDCLDFSGTDASLEKSARRDLEMGTITLPLIYAFQASPGLRDIVANPHLTREDMNTVVEAVRDSGAIHRAMELARRYHQRAQQRLNRVPDFPEKRQLALFLERSLARTK